ncbi:MAG: phage terminase large subunit [Bacteroidales bacterium]|nr:phage terminase large subunit [Bacteroidales bacterium]
MNTAAISEWENMIADLNLKDFFHRVNSRYTYMPNGSSIVFKGFQTSSEAVEAMKGFSNLSIAYVDEAQSTDEEAFDNLIGSIRSNKDMKCIVSLNPTTQDSWLYQRFFKNLPSEDFSGIIGNKLYVYSYYKDVAKYVGKTKIDLIE